MLVKLNQVVPNTFHQEHLRVNKLLDDCLYGLFPNQEYINANLKNLTPVQKNVKYYKKNFLPFHTRDTFWLANYLEQVFNQTQALKKFSSQRAHVGVTLSYIKKYVEESPKFDAVRNYYEQNLVRAYINMTLDYQADDFFSKGIVKTDERNALNYDQLFRNRVVNAMTFLGVERGSIEIGLEANADLWRDKVKRQTFFNNYSMDNMNAVVSPDGILAKNAPNRWKKLTNMGSKLYQRWSDLNDYQYYQQHHAVIDKLGTATPNMLITTEKANKLELDTDAMAFEFECLLYKAAETVANIVNESKAIERDIQLGLI